MTSDVDPAFWKGRRVFLTGHTGFKGSWLTAWLVRMGALVSGYALAPATTPDLFSLLHGASVRDGEIHSTLADVRDGARLTQALVAASPEVVIHMAAQPLVRRSYLEPVETYSTNVMGTVHLLEAVRAASGVRAVVVVTSDKCYENREWDWGYRETDPMGGHDPYSSSKGCTELVAASYRNAFFSSSGQTAHAVALATARAGNVIGGGDWSEDRLIPDLMRAIVSGRPARIRNPGALRPWQHVLEPLSGYLVLAQHLVHRGAQAAQAWNFGPRDFDTRPVSWLVEHMVRSWGPGASWEIEDSAQPHEATHLKLDCSRAHSQLGWLPRWDLARTIDAIVAWHRAHQEGRDMRAFTLAQIEEFEGTARHV